ncbi:MAG: DUF4832 domain-containing protein [Cyanobacteria bacterium P01_H01_bin.150]
MKTSLKKRVSSSCLMVIASLIFGCRIMPLNASMVETSYERSSDNFPNPERGFYIQVKPIGNQPAPPLSVSQLQAVRNEKISLIRRIYLLSAFRQEPLSESFLKLVKDDLDTARKAGVKLIIRFSYNWLGGGEDATKERIFSHMEQLKPVLQENYDVIAYLNAGFIGFWGEWNNSSNGLREDSEAKKAILLEALSLLPPERMVAIRYPYYKREIFSNNNPLNSEEAFSGSDRSRTGHHNDCFLEGFDNGGTYNALNPDDIDNQKDYLNLDNRFVVQGGELCYLKEWDPSNKSDDCPNALNELERMRWSALNFRPSDGREIIQDWENQGCLQEIKRRLGYRFRLEQSSIPSNVKPGGQFSMNFEITNDGWASPYNPRKLEIVIRHQETNKEYYLTLDEEPRMWLPGTNKVVRITAGIPVDLPQGKYEVLLNLPDPHPRLYQRPEYSIRLANKNIWEESTGYNSLKQSIMVDENAEAENYSGTNFFKPR